MKHFAEVLRYLSSIEYINRGGCGVAALAIYRWLKKHDKLKQMYCNDNNIPLLRIPYTWFDDETWKEKFNHFIKPLRINDP